MQPRGSLAEGGEARDRRCNVLDLRRRDPQSRTRGDHCKPLAFHSHRRLADTMPVTSTQGRTMTARRGSKPPHRRCPAQPSGRTRPRQIASGRENGGLGSTTYRPRSVSSLLILFSAIVSVVSRWVSRVWERERNGSLFGGRKERKVSGVLCSARRSGVRATTSCEGRIRSRVVPENRCRNEKREMEFRSGMGVGRTDIENRESMWRDRGFERGVPEADGSGSGGAWLCVRLATSGRGKNL